MPHMHRISKERAIRADVLCGDECTSKARLLLKRDHSYLAVCEYNGQIHAFAVLDRLSFEQQIKFKTNGNVNSDDRRYIDSR